MQETSALYKALMSEEHYIETRLVLGEKGVLVTQDAEAIVFGTGSNGTRILVQQGGAEDGFTEAEIFSIRTFGGLFTGNTPSVGNAIASEIEVSMINPIGAIERMAQMVPYVRLSSKDGTRKSEWIKKGVYYIDTREVEHNDNALDVLILHGYDAMAKAQADYPSSTISYPALDTAIVGEIAKAMGVPVDPRTYEVMDRQYTYGLPAGYSMYEVLCNIAASYAGNFIISDVGALRLVTFAELPPETRYLVTETGYAIVFGGDRILV